MPCGYVVMCYFDLENLNGFQHIFSFVYVFVGLAPGPPPTSARSSSRRGIQLFLPADILPH